MNLEDFARQLDRAKARADGLQVQTAQLSLEARPLLMSIFDELHTALEELHASQEELQHQHEALQLAHRDLDFERQRYHHLFEFAPDAYLVTNGSTTILEANQAAAQLLGYPKAQLIGLLLLRFIPKGGLHSFQPLLARPFPNDEVRSWTGVMETAQHAWRDITLTVVTVPGQDTSMPIYHWAIRDITERKRAEDDRLARELLETQKLESLGIIASGIAHDFNNLLTIIQANAQLAMLDLPDDRSSLHTSIEQIQHATRRSAELVRQILDYVGKSHVAPQALDLNLLVSEMLALLRTSLPEQIELQTDLVAELLPIHADATQLRQIVLNLVVNAAEAIAPRAGAITVSTQVVPAAHVDSLRLVYGLIQKADMYVVLHVSDTGSGITSATRVRMFDPFFTTKFTGRGLGLAVVLGIVRAHGGGLAVQSAPNQGTRMSIYWPAIGAKAQLAVERGGAIGA